jgi:DNA-binding CsgD family transcriptional regulator
MLFGRERECQALDRLLADARRGRSGALVLAGEPGIGKTALLRYAREHADGMRVLQARGIESEAEIPFAGLLELLRPALGLLDRIPEPQASALAGALALGPGGGHDRFAVGAATLSLLAAYADDAPLALLVDDVHWLDGASGEALVFAVRRFIVDPIAAVLAVREGEPSPLEGLDVPVLRLQGLERTAAVALLGPSTAEAAGADAIDRLYRATAGNPLALLELAPDALRLAASPAEPVPVPTAIARAFLRRAADLPESTRRILVLAAASDNGDLAPIGRAAASLALDVAELAAAETAGLVDLQDRRVQFRHPLAQSAIYAEAPAEERRSAHRALAATLPDREVDRRAWHLAAAAVGPDAAASAALEQAAAQARDRSAYAAAATGFERAARLAPDDTRRPALLYAAADAAWLAGLGERAVALLEETRTLATDRSLARRIEHLRGHVVMRRGPIMDGHAILVAAAEQTAAEDPDRAVVMLAEAVNACFYAGRAEEMLETAERAAAILPAATGDDARFFGRLAHGMALVFAGEGEQGAALIRSAVEVVQASAELRADPRLLAWTAMGPIWLREAGETRRLVDAALETARARAAIGALPFLLQHVAHDQAASDRWGAAHASFDEAIRLARETGQQTELAAALAGLAWLEARRGEENACRTLAAETIDLTSRLGVALYEIWAITALGDLELGLGRPLAAIERFEEQHDRLRALGIGDVDLSPVPELVEANLRLTRRAEAEAAFGDYAQRALRKGQPWALARAARCRGLLGGDEELDRHFDEALRLHEQTPDVFEAARTRLVYGGRLRRARRRVRAREELRQAVDVFDALGAAPWAEAARAELAATGETARRRDDSSRDALTPQELQVAFLASDGKTTREVAAALFLSPKTIEYHLRHVYRKLGVASRDELRAALEQQR